MENVKIILLHNGRQNYFRLVVRQVLEFNDINDVVILSKTLRSAYFEKVKVFDINKYSKKANAFSERYIHLSSNLKNFELFCIQRWFIINEFIERNNIIGPFVHMDSDVLLYRNVNELWNLYLKNDTTICNKRVPAFMFFKSRKVIESLCMFIENMYSNNIQFLQNIYKKEFVDTVKDGGICDMRLIEWWLMEAEVKSLDISNVIVDDSCCDSVFSDPGPFEYDNDRHQKKCILVNNKFYFLDINKNRVRCNLIHFQGKEKKRIIHQYYISNGSNYPNKLCLAMNLIYYISTPKYLIKDIAKKMGIINYIKRMISSIK